MEHESQILHDSPAWEQVKGSDKACSSTWLNPDLLNVLTHRTPLPPDSSTQPRAARHTVLYPGLSEALHGALHLSSP